MMFVCGEFTNAVVATNVDADDVDGVLAYKLPVKVLFPDIFDVVDGAT